MANTEKVVKLTKKDFYAAIKEMIIMSEVETVGEIPTEEVIAFIDKTVEQIGTKAARAKEKAAEKRSEGDEIFKVVVEALTEELQTIDEITEAVVAATGDEEITKSKVTARLTKAVKDEVARKEQVKVGTRRVMAYALKAVETIEESVDTETAEETVGTEETE